MTYNQFVPYTDRLDYLAPLANNMAYAIAVERLAGIKVPPRCEAIRVITAEMARISSHLMGLGAFGIDTGAWTVFMYTFTEREKLYRLFEELTGARFTTSYTRIGGVTRDVPEGWLDRAKQNLHGPHGRRGDHLEGRRAQLRHHRPQSPRQRHRARSAQGQALLGLRAV
jgi:NADH-quinone oxidoreductase subunit D